MHNFEVAIKEDFFNFLIQLQQDLKNNPKKWENNSLSAFLNAIHRYTEDIQAHYNNTSQNIDSNQAL